jgi:hypothetical protein
MRTLSGLCIIFLSGTILSAQIRSGFRPGFGNVRQGFGNVVFPGGVTQPGVQRNAGNAVFPASPGPKVGVPPNLGFHFGSRFGGQNFCRRGQFGDGAAAIPYPYPVFAGNYPGDNYDPSYQQPMPQQQPNIMVIYPPAQAPVVVNPISPDQTVVGAGPVAPTPDMSSSYQAPPQDSDNTIGQGVSDQSPGYLVALKDHTIYPAVAYWVEGDTLHYFTTGNDHNMVSLALVDRDLTERLNREKGTAVQLPK